MPDLEMPGCRRILRMALIVLAATTTPGIAGAQVDRQDWGFWTSLAIGSSTPYPLGVAVTGTIRHGRLLTRFRYAAAAEFLGDWDEDMGGLVGIVLTPDSSRGQLSVGAGIGTARRIRGCTICQKSVAEGQGLLLDFEGRVAILGVFGLTFYGFGDLNAHQSFCGIGLGVYFGTK